MFEPLKFDFMTSILFFKRNIRAVFFSLIDGGIFLNGLDYLLEAVLTQSQPKWK